MKIDVLGKEIGVLFIPMMGYFSLGPVEDMQNAVNKGGTIGDMGVPSSTRT